MLVAESANIAPNETDHLGVACIRITILWGTVVLEVHHLTPPRDFFVGEVMGRDIDALLPGEVLGAVRWQLLRCHRDDVTVLVPFAAGNFIYIALTDLLPEITTSPVLRDKALYTTTFVAGIVLLWAVAQLA